jgi:hypothetical protein
MTPQPAVTTHLPLDPATADQTLATIFGALRHDPEDTPAQHQSQRTAGVALIEALRPRDPIEATCATRAAAAHYASIECFRRAMLPDMPDGLILRWQGKAVALSRMNMELMRELKLRQAEAPCVPPQVTTSGAEAAAAAAPTPSAPVGKQNPMPSERAPIPAAVATRQAVSAPSESAKTTRPAAPIPRTVVGRQNPTPSEPPRFIPAASIRVTEPGRGSMLSAAFVAGLAPRHGSRAREFGSAADISGLLDTANVRGRLHVQ